MKKVLPPTYYLDHFKEFIEHIKKQSEHLLRPQDRQFLQRFNNLNHQQQCLLVRMLNRSNPCMKIESLMNYEEIPGAQHLLDQLIEKQLASPINKEDMDNWLEIQTKPELLQLCEGQCDNNPPKKSAQKKVWIEWAQSLPPASLLTHANTANYVSHTNQASMEYLLFLYFGHIGGKLSQFSMRDLGVLATQKRGVDHHSRFTTLEEASSCYEYMCILKKIKYDKNRQHYLEAFSANQLPEVVGSKATELADKLLLELGSHILQEDADLALDLWQKSNHPNAIEKRIRLLYRNGSKEDALKELHAIIDSPLSEGLLVFAQDFLDRKFHKKRTSLLTDMLREHDPIHMDEAYTGFVEQGLVDHLAKQNCTAFHSENSLWRALFALTFWDLLYLDARAGRHSEFDYQPACLKENRFYEVFTNEVNDLFAKCHSRENLIRHIQKQFTQYYDQPNGLFFWHKDLLLWLTEFIQTAPIDAVIHYLKDISQNYPELSDGYPDLMVLKDDSLQFIEVKAPGDQLRRNQLVTINKLVKAGFQVQIQSVKWRYNPEQIYCVIDIETTGGGSDKHRITEVGITKVQHGTVIGQWQSLINPQRNIPKYITELTGINDQMVVDAPLFSDVADDILRFINGSIFVAHNVAFDYGFFRQEFARLNINFKSPKLCTVRLAKQYFPKLPSYSLGKLCNSLGIELNQHHRALADAQAAVEILIKVNKIRSDIIKSEK